jgi:hypothetical protein
MMRGMMLNPPPGCREQQVRQVTRRPGWPGAFLKFACGHEQWVAGLTEIDPVGMDWPCLQGPCYEPQRAMGEHC